MSRFCDPVPRDELEARTRLLMAWARGLGSGEEWALLFNLEIALLNLARQAPLEDGRWSRLAFDVECRLGDLEAGCPGRCGIPAD